MINYLEDDLLKVKNGIAHYLYVNNWLSDDHYVRNLFDNLFN